MREMTRSEAAVAREALAVGESALPRYASKYSRLDGFTLPQLFACLAVRKFLGQDYGGWRSSWPSGPNSAGRSGCLASPTTATIMPVVEHQPDPARCRRLHCPHFAEAEPAAAQPAGVRSLDR